MLSDVNVQRTYVDVGMMQIVWSPTFHPQCCGICHSEMADFFYYCTTFYYCGTTVTKCTPLITEMFQWSVGDVNDTFYVGATLKDHIALN